MPAAISDLLNAARPHLTPLLVYQIAVSVFVAFALANAVADWFTFRRPAEGEAPPAPNSEGAGTTEKPVALSASGTPRIGDGGGLAPSLSVLIPARDEEATLGPCIRSLLAQDYPGDLEILVLDDHSGDGTARVLAELAAGEARVRPLAGGPLLPGWKGKPNALRQLAPHATGDVLLLTDADCTFFPGALASAVRHRERVGADCLSLIPYLECRTFWEHVVVPLQYFLVFATLPVRNVYASRNPAFAAANGAFLLLPRETYDALGGHESVKGEMAEDIKFAQHVKRSGRKLVYGDGSRVYAVRMYDGLRAIWDGFSKNLFPAMGKSLPVLIVWSLFLLCTQVLPFAFLAFALATGRRSPAGFWFPLAHVGVALALRIALSVRFRQSVWAAATHPVGWLITLGIGANSAYLAYSGRGHAWKGRVYET